MKQAIILAGGKGTRLQERLNGLPKPLIDICGKPLLARQIEALKSDGFDQVLILVNHGADQIIHFCQQHHNWNIDVQCLDDGTPLGTAGAVIQIFPKLAEDFLVVYGDTMFDIDLARFQAFHEEDIAAGATLFLHPNDHPQDSDLVAMNEQDQITGFYPYPHSPDIYLPNLVNAGLYYFRKAALKDWIGSKEMLDFGKDIFPALINKGVLLRGYNSPEYIKDCGTPKRLDKVCSQYESGFISASNLRFKQKLVFLDRDGTINQLVDQLAHTEDFELLSGAPEAIAQLNKSGYRTVVVTNQPVLARGECTFQELENIHRKMQTQLGRHGAYLDRIYFCPHHPESGFAGEVKALKVDCNCRKPASGMLEQAAHDLNADLSASWMIGDSTADLMAAKSAGVHSILVQTGAAGLDEKYPVVPDFICPNLPTAVQFVLQEHPRLVNLVKQFSGKILAGDVVLIGGLSRSGKSTLAHCLKDALAQQGIRSCVVPVDGWLKALDERGQTVLERYDIPALNLVLEKLANRQQSLKLAIPIYSKRALITQHVIEEMIEPADVVIVEGTIALELEAPRSKAQVHRWYVELDEGQRKARVIKEYGLRGKTELEAQQIYAQRQQDETPLIGLSKSKASEHINLGLPDELS
jgi:histidinol-phosphate phosphatase family protein